MKTIQRKLLKYRYIPVVFGVIILFFVSLPVLSTMPFDSNMLLFPVELLDRWEFWIGLIVISCIIVFIMMNFVKADIRLPRGRR